MKQENSPAINVVICNDDWVSYAFAVAVIDQNIKTGMDSITIANASPGLLGSEELFRNVVTEELSNYQFGNKQHKAVPYPEKIHLYLIDIGPRNDWEMAQLVSFLERHESEVVLWVDTLHNWFRRELVYVNQYRDLLKWDRSRSPLQLLERFGYHSLPYWKAAEAALISREAAALNSNGLAWRYFHSAQAARVESHIFWRDNDQTFFLLAVIDELSYRRINSDVSYYKRIYPKISRLTNNAKLMISDDSEYFPKSRQMGRQVGYINLGPIGSLIDVDEILSYGQSQYPWLFILEYTLDNRLFLEAVSAKVDVPPLLKSPVVGARPELDYIKELLDIKLATYQDNNKILKNST